MNPRDIAAAAAKKAREMAEARDKRPAAPPVPPRDAAHGYTAAPAAAEGGAAGASSEQDYAARASRISEEKTRLSLALRASVALEGIPEAAGARPMSWVELEAPTIPVTPEPTLDNMHRAFAYLMTILKNDNDESLKTVGVGRLSGGAAAVNALKTALTRDCDDAEFARQPLGGASPDLLLDPHTIVGAYKKMFLDNAANLELKPEFERLLLAGDVEGTIDALLNSPDLHDVRLAQAIHDLMYFSYNVAQHTDRNQLNPISIGIAITFPRLFQMCPEYNQRPLIAQIIPSAADISADRTPEIFRISQAITNDRFSLSFDARHPEVAARFQRELPPEKPDLNQLIHRQQTLLRELEVLSHRPTSLMFSEGKKQGALRAKEAELSLVCRMMIDGESPLQAAQTKLRNDIERLSTVMQNAERDIVDLAPDARGNPAIRQATQELTTLINSKYEQLYNLLQIEGSIIERLHKPDRGSAPTARS